MTHMQGDTHSPRRRRMAGCRAVAILAGCSAALAGCASAPPPPPPTVINITMTAAPDVNPDSQGTASPLQLRIYQLGSTAQFQQCRVFPGLSKGRSNAWNRHRETGGFRNSARGPANPKA